MFSNTHEARIGLRMFALMLLTFAVPTDPNRAPAVVFVGIGLALVIVFVVLLLTIPISGEDFTPSETKYYGGPFGGF
jgi:hypothetical protein